MDTPALPVVQPRSRLVIEQLDEWLAESAQLRLSQSLSGAQPQASSPESAQAAALWQALNTPPEAVQKANERLLQQQADIMAARASSEKMQATIVDLQQRMERLDRERFGPTLVYGLLALLLVALALLGWLWMQTQSAWRRSGAAWSTSVSFKTSDPQAALNESAAYHHDEPEPAWEEPLVADAASKLPVVPAIAAVAARMPEPAPVAVAPAPMAPTVRVVNPEALFDLHEQAEFFMSVGEHDQAIEVMKMHIADNEKTSPSIYLELLRLYRALSRIEDFNHLRVQFHQYFNAQVPEFSVFHTASRTLFDYPESLAAIEAVWSDASVLPLLESYIFCSGGGSSSAAERFELPAYDDLLMLYAIASTTPPQARGAPLPRQRTTPKGPRTPSAAAALAAPLLQVPVTLEKNRGLDMEMDMTFGRDTHFNSPPDAPLDTPLDKPSGIDTDAVPASTVGGNLMDYDDFLLSDRVALDAEPLPPSPAANDWTLDIDLSEPGWDFGDPLPQFTRSEDVTAPGTPAPVAGSPVVKGADSNPFEILLDLEERDRDRS